MTNACNAQTHPRRGGRILSLGELLVDLIPTESGGRIDQTGAVLKVASGSAGIFACAAAALGGQSSFLGKVGKDPLSRMVYDTVRSFGVDMSRVVISDEGQVGLAFIEYLPDGSRNYEYYRTRSIGSLYRADELDVADMASAYALHFPGMLLELSPELREASLFAARAAKEHGVLLSFDPNIRFELNQKESLDRMILVIRMADVIAPTLAEGRLITGKESAGDVLRALHAMGPGVVALTRDKDGAAVSCNGQVALCDGIDVPVVDPTGAGDTFAAALVVALQQGMSLSETALFCNCAGTLVVTKRGAIGQAIPSLQDVQALMATNPCQVRVVPLNELP
jgi:sugar/nucleoside kinase (ribokinase family)